MVSEKPKTSSRLDEQLRGLERLHPKSINLGLDRILGLLERLGHPERQLPPVIHIAGTNGKGSVVAFTRAIAEAAGLRVHAYTSPHLVSFNERIRIAGKLIEDDHLSELIEDCRRINGQTPITFFEMTTAVAFLAFSQIEADLCLLEVGLGGRLDATNVIDAPAAVGITPIAIDHIDFLGDKLTDIAAEKAGIIKRNAPVVIGAQSGQVMQHISKRAEALAAPIEAHGRNWRVAITGEEAIDRRLLYYDRKGSLTLPLPALPGAHQAMNAGHAVALMRRQNAVDIPEAAIRAGLDWARWPARLQRLEGGAWTDPLPDGAEVWLDGAHNPAAAGAIKDHFRLLDPDERPFFLICGMMANRVGPDFFRPFTPLAKAVYAVPVPGQPNSARPCEVAAAASDAGLQALMASTPQAAIAAISQTVRAGQAPVIVIAGSLYLAGEILRGQGWQAV